MYLAGGGKPPQKLSRLGNLNWTLANFIPNDGPWMEPNTVETTTIYASAVSGSVTLTATTNVFTEDHVGVLIRLEVQDLSKVRPWEPGKAITANSLRRSDGKTYKASNTSTTGSVKPVHTKGTAYDGSDSDKGVNWLYQDAGYGVARITAVTDALTATATVISTLPANVVDVANATWRWTLGAWGAHNEHPTQVTLWRERLVWAGRSRVWMSVAGDYESMAPDDYGQQVADSAITIEVGSQKNDAIRWLAPTDALLVGTAGSEFAIVAQTESEPLGPANIKSAVQTGHGSKGVQPERMGSAVAYVDRSGRRVRECGYDADSAVYQSRDVTIIADHILVDGCTEVAFQGSPDDVLWAVAGDSLVGFTYQREQNIYAWHRHPTDGSVESVATLPAPTTDRDDVWVSVVRFGKRLIEWMDAGLPLGGDHHESFYVDSGLSYDGAIAATLYAASSAQTQGATNVSFDASADVFEEDDVGRRIQYRYNANGWRTATAKITSVLGADKVYCTILSPFPAEDVYVGCRLTTTTVSGLDHLEGQAVAILADGSVLPSQTVSDGAVSLAVPAGRIHAGLPYSCRVRLMRYEAPQSTAQAKTKRAHEVTFRFVETTGVEVGPDWERLDALTFRVPSYGMDVAVPLYSGDMAVQWPLGYDTDGYICVQSSTPLPMTLAAVFPEMEVQR
jgi:hypothetical protein